MSCNTNELVKLIVDDYNGVADQFCGDESPKDLINAAVQDIFGKEKISFKDLRKRSKNEAFFDVVSEVLEKTVLEGFVADPIVDALVDSRNIALCDEQAFDIEDDDDIVVSEISNGNQKFDRQRIGAGSRIYVPTRPVGCSVYEEFRRIKSGVIDFNSLISRVQKAYNRDLRQRIWTAFEGMFSDLTSYTGIYYKNGTYDATTLLTLCEHVAAEANSDVVIVGSRLALNQINLDANSSRLSAEGKKDIYDIGYIGKFNGIPCMAIQQFHKLNTANTFGVPVNDLFILPTDGRKPIKYITEGEFYTSTINPEDHADLTAEYKFWTNYGIAVVGKSQLGKYSISNG